MIPIDALTGACITTKLYNDDHIHGDCFVRGRGMRHKPGHGLTLGARDVQFIH
jgi:hypothetical protein